MFVEKGMLLFSRNKYHNRLCVYYVFQYVSLFKRRAAEKSEKWMSEWCVEAEKHKAEAERLKRQVQAIKETADRHRDEIRDKDSILNR